MIKKVFPKNTERKKTSVAALKDLLELKCSIGGTKSANFVTLLNGGIVINKFSSRVQQRILLREDTTEPARGHRSTQSHI